MHARQDEAEAEVEGEAVEVGPPQCSRVVLEACMKGKAGAVKNFYDKEPEALEKINELKSLDNGWTPLQVAAGYGFDACVTALLELKADPSVTDNNGMNALHSAADTDEKAIIKLLLDNEQGKAAIDAQDQVRVACGRPTRIAGRPPCGQTRTARMAGRARAERARARTALTALASPCAASQDGCTPLHYAAYSAREAIVISLLRAGAKTDIADGEGKTALQVAQAVKANAIAALITDGPPPEEEAVAPAAE
jgi:hypothetical protein